MLTTGLKGRQEITVNENNTAASCGSGLLDVLSTPHMIALIEMTAWQSVQAELEEGQGTVGTRLDVKHLAASPVGMKVRCETELVEIDRRHLVFEASVYDECGLVGSGTHERFIIDNEKFIAKANARNGLH